MGCNVTKTERGINLSLVKNFVSNEEAHNQQKLAENNYVFQSSIIQVKPDDGVMRNQSFSIQKSDTDSRSKSPSGSRVNSFIQKASKINLASQSPTRTTYIADRSPDNMKSSIISMKCSNIVPNTDTRHIFANNNNNPILMTNSINYGNLAPSPMVNQNNNNYAMNSSMYHPQKISVVHPIQYPNQYSNQPYSRRDVIMKTPQMKNKYVPSQMNHSPNLVYVKKQDSSFILKTPKMSFMKNSEASFGGREYSQMQDWNSGQQQILDNQVGAQSNETLKNPPQGGATNNDVQKRSSTNPGFYTDNLSPIKMNLSNCQLLNQSDQKINRKTFESKPNEVKESKKNNFAIPQNVLGEISNKFETLFKTYQSISEKLRDQKSASFQAQTVDEKLNDQSNQNFQIDINIEGFEKIEPNQIQDFNNFIETRIKECGIETSVTQLNYRFAPYKSQEELNEADKNKNVEQNQASSQNPYHDIAENQDIEVQAVEFSNIYESLKQHQQNQEQNNQTGPFQAESDENYQSASFSSQKDNLDVILEKCETSMISNDSMISNPKKQHQNYSCPSSKKNGENADFKQINQFYNPDILIESNKSNQEMKEIAREYNLSNRSQSSRTSLKEESESQQQFYRKSNEDCLLQQIDEIRDKQDLERDDDFVQNTLKNLDNQILEIERKMQSQKFQSENSSKCSTHRSDKSKQIKTDRSNKSNQSQKSTALKKSQNKLINLISKLDDLNDSYKQMSYQIESHVNNRNTPSSYNSSADSQRESLAESRNKENMESIDSLRNYVESGVTSSKDMKQQKINLNLQNF